MSQTKTQLVDGLNINTSAPADALAIDNNGRVGIGTTSPSQLLHLAAALPVLNIDSSSTTGDGAQIRFEQNNGRVGRLYLTAEGGPGAGAMTLETPDGRDIVFKRTSTENARIDSSGRLLLGVTSTAGSNEQLQVMATTGAQVGLGKYANDTRGAYLQFHKSRGGVGNHGLVSSGDEAGQILFNGSDGTFYRACATIEAWIDGTATTGGAMPGRLVFSTTAGGATNPTERMRIDSSGNLKFNSGYGSVATAYGCRAWVNFQGTSTVTIRSSGNVSSITDEGTGDYRINFSTAMPDDNYGVAPCSYAQSGASMVVVLKFASPSGHPMTTNWVAVVSENTSGRLDIEFCCVAIFR